MNDRLFRSAGFAQADARALVTTVVVTVYDRGPSAAPDERYEAELAGYAAVREAAASPWEAVRALVGHQRRRAPRLVLLRSDTVGHRHAELVALVSDGRRRYTVALEFASTRAGWQVDRIGS